MARRSRQQTNRAVRLLIQYDNRRLAVSSRQEVEMATPPSDPVRGYEGRSGFWYEVRGSKDQVLYRRVVANPLPTDVEVYDPETGPRRHPTRRSSAAFAVLIPDLPDASNLVIMSSPLDPRLRMAAAVPLARIPLGGKRRRR
jgi:hypothetical protein